MSTPGPEQGEAAEEEVSEGATATELARLLSYLLLLAFAAGLYIMAGNLPISRWDPLGAGAFPQLVMALLGGVCFLGIVLSLRRLAQGGVSRVSRRYLAGWISSHRLVFYVFMDFAIYLAVLKYLGFSLATFLFLLSAQIIVAPRSWRSLVTALIIAVAFSFGLNWLFANVFTVFLPRGILG